MGIAVRKQIDDPSQILNEAVDISFHANAFGKGMNQSVLTMCK